MAALLVQNATLRADAVDTSAAMLNLLRDRCQQAAPSVGLRLNTHRTDALNYVAASAGGSYDLVVAHFFLDCLTQTELESLTTAVSAKLAPSALWLVSDFRIPSGFISLPARALVRGLYLAFRILTGLRTDRLPDHAAVLTRTGFTRIAHHHSLFGVLTTELWRQQDETAENAGCSVIE